MPTTTERRVLVNLEDLRWAVERIQPFAMDAHAFVIFLRLCGKVANRTRRQWVLTHYGNKKMSVIKVVRAYTGLGFKEATDAVESGNFVLREAVTSAALAGFIHELRAAGATVVSR